VTLFEYLAIAFGLLFSLSALRLIGGLPAALDGERGYWVHRTLVVTLLLHTAFAFWTSWSLSEVAWTLPRFFLALGIPGILYFNVATLIPADPPAVSSWREYYYEVRARFFVGVTAWMLVIAAGSFVNLGMPIAHPARVTQALFLSIGLIGMSSSRHRVHAGLAISWLVILLLAAITVGAGAGWVTN